MGLDMYLNKKTYVGNNYKKPKDQVRIKVKGVRQKRVVDIVERIGYWRKANAIHGWLVDNVQEGVDDCKEYYVSQEQMKELLGLVNQVLKDPKKAKKLLPVRSGFFFGNYDPDKGYDKWYIDDLKLTKKILTVALKDKDSDFYYESSW